MSIAKKLAGGGGSFGALTQDAAPAQDQVLARSEALDATGRVRRSSLAPVSSIVFNPLNPRRTIIEETIAELAESLRTHGQISPVTVVSRDAFLAAHPDQAGALGDAEFVALEGNRRLHAAHRAGLESLRVDLNDDLVATATDMLQSALAANTHREAVPELEEARAIQQLLDTTYQGNQAAVARALSKTPAWVGQRLALLHLTPEVQEMVETGELTVKAARRIGAAARRGDLTGEQQMEAARAATAPAKATAPAADVNPVYPPAAQAGAAAADGSAPVAGVNPVYSTTVADPSPESTGAAVRPEDVNPVYSRETAGEHTADSSQGAEDGPTQESVGDGGDVNPVYSDRQAAVPDQRAEAVSASLTLHLDLRDVTAAARTIRASVDARTALQLAGALLAIVQSEPGGKAVLQSIRHRNG